ncbi:MAG: hemerythrin domain-containing protein [Bryobacteraceae bacterium]|nr:hemerythrin domain-containing protein [Bryobacteraceae bacterium]
MLRDPGLVPLSHQHHNGLALCVLVERALGEAPSDELLAQQAQRIIDRFEVELVNHFALEEELLFPACASSGLDAVVRDLIADHRELERLVETLRSQPALEGIKSFTHLLRRHIRREENELFEETQRRLPPEALGDLGRLLEQRVVKVCL